MQKLITNFIYSNLSLVAYSKKCGACPKLLAILSKNDLGSKICIGKETAMMDFPDNRFEPILLIMSNITLL